MLQKKLYNQISFKSRMSYLVYLFSIITILSCYSIQTGEYEISKLESPSKSEAVTFELVEILNKGETYKASAEEFKKTEEWLQKALQQSGYPDVKLSKGGIDSSLHFKIKIDVHNPPWYRMVLAYLHATATVGTLGIIPYFVDGVYHVFYFEVSRSGKPSQNYKIKGPELTFWWGWFAPWLGKRGDSEELIIESWKLIVQRFNTQVRYKK
ncbi:MAG: hypothetical protein SFU98_02855 [Leptospiraceae bacterium]|nr:hypothetical protein [Leptospiraceae bacterium]